MTARKVAAAAVALVALAAGAPPAAADSGPRRDTTPALESHPACLVVVDQLVDDFTRLLQVERAYEVETAKLYRRLDRQARQLDRRAATIARLRDRLAR